MLANDAIAGISTLTCGGTLVITNLGTDALAPGDSFKLFTATNYAGSFASFNLPPLATNLFWNTSQVALNGSLTVLAVVPPTLSGRMVPDGSGFQLSCSGPSGQTYTVLTSTNLILPLTNWLVLTNGVFNSGPAIINVNLSTATNQTGFYRILSP